MECNLNHSEKYTKMCIKLYLKFLFSNIQDGGSGGLVILSKKKQVSYELQIWSSPKKYIDKPEI